MKAIGSLSGRVLLSFVAVMVLTQGVATFAQDADFDKTKKDVEKALKAKDAKALAEAVSRLVTMDNGKALDVILDSFKGKVNANDQDLYWILIRGAATFTSASAADMLGEFVQRYQKDFIVRDILSLLKSNRSTDLLPMLSKLIEKGDDNLKAIVVDHLQEFPGKEVGGILIDAMKRAGNKGGGIKAKIAAALRSLTGQDFGEDAQQWSDWWEKNKDQEWAKSGPSAGGSASGTVVDTLDKSRKSDFERLKTPFGKIVVLHSECDHAGTKGSHDFDRIENVLSKLGIAFTSINKKEVETYDLTDVIAILVNCNQWREHCVCPDCKPSGDTKDRLKTCVCSRTPPFHQNVSTKFSDEAVKRIQAYVMQGGYLFTEDWVLEELLQRAFPGIVKRGDYMKEGEAGVVPYAGTAAHPYMKGTFGLRKRSQGGGEADASGTGVSPQDVFEDVMHTWKIDSESPIVVVENKQAVTPLLFSPQLSKDYPQGGIAALTFAAGMKKLENIGTGFEQSRDRMSGGRVLHVLSHFGKQKSAVDEFALQNLLVNFLIEANERRSMAVKK